MDIEWDALEAAGLFDDVDAAARRELIEFLAGEGLTTGELVAAHERGALFRAAGDKIIRPGAGQLSLRDIATELGADVETVQRVWRSVGAIDPGPDARVASPDDIVMVAAGLEMLALVGEQQGWALLRRFGSVIERLTEATSSAVITAVADIAVDQSGSETATAKVWAGLAASVPKLGRLLDLSLRHQVESVRRYFEMAALPAIEGRAEMHLAVGFLDMSGFTATSRTVGLDALAEVVAEFESRVSEVISGYGGRIVKFVGDAVLFVCLDPNALAAAAATLVAPLEADGVQLSARAGLAFGPVIAQDGDYFGTPVNLAARLVDIAEPAAMVATPELAALLDTACWVFTEQEPLPLKGFDDPVATVLVQSASGGPAN